MRGFKYSLDPSSKKFICPSCGKRRFVRYIDNETGEYISDDCGRCDREQSCGYHLTPSDYFHDHGMAVERHRPTPRRPLPPLIEPTYIDGNIVAATVRRPVTASNLYRYLVRLAAARYGTAVAEMKARGAMIEMNVGTTLSGDAIFWQCDQHQRCRTGKIMAYQPNGHRVKNEGSPHRVDWVHSRLQHRWPDRFTDFTLVQCLFGLHQLADNRDNDLPIGLVESEKTALMGRLLSPSHIWVATGGSNGLNAHKLRPLRGRVIHVYPDLGEFDKWAGIIEQSGLSRVTMMRLVEDIATDNDRKQGLDIGDYWERELLSSPP